MKNFTNFEIFYIKSFDVFEKYDIIFSKIIINFSYGAVVWVCGLITTGITEF